MWSSYREIQWSYLLVIWCAKGCAEGCAEGCACAFPGAKGVP